MNYLCATESSECINVLLCGIWGSHGSDYILGWHAMLSGGNLRMFQGNLLPLYSSPKNKPSKQQASIVLLFLT
jgi:hypothetical protein